MAHNKRQCKTWLRKEKKMNWSKLPARGEAECGEAINPGRAKMTGRKL